MSSLKKFYTGTRNTAPTYQMATVAEVNNSLGVRLLFDGTTTATTKYYKVAVGMNLSVGDRVKIVKYSGTYVVEYKIGLPSEAGTTISFKINGVDHTAAESAKWADWIGTHYNTEGYERIYIYSDYYLSLDGATPLYNCKGSTIIANHNYIGLNTFQINGTTYQMYDGITGGSWINTPQNTAALKLVYGTPSGYASGYYFCTGSTISTAVAYFGASTAYNLTAGHNYTMSG